MNRAANATMSADHAWGWQTIIMVILALLIMVYLMVSFFDEFMVCGFNRSYTSGTIVEMRRDISAEKDPHGRTEPEFRLAWRPVIRLEEKGSREVVAPSEWAPSERKVGDKVQVCYSRQKPELVYITH